MQNQQPVQPNPGQEYVPTQNKQCKDLLFLDIAGQRVVFECEIPENPGEHPGQPHMARLPSIELGDEIFLGWWHNPPSPPSKQTVFFTRTKEQDEGWTNE